ncbi:CEP41_2 [Blepharisma stoltei]|uniref:Rhodanese domain-containing protein n=1 Tax=Blepharisma stoltei TaxID=1481888 RepID=A0AAU9JQ27_9CILI|nr:unnamed protein product [Blepharisma stoltei]
MVDKRPTQYRPKSDPIQKKVPKNPKYEGVTSVINTGKTMRQVEILSNQTVAKRRGELFRRIRCGTLAKLIEESSTKESIYDLARDGEEVKEIEDTASIYSMAVSEAPSAYSVVTVNTEALGVNQETEFVVLDLRDEDEYNRFHIKDSISFPSPNVTRDRILPQVFRLKNQQGKFIIVYAWDERPGVEAAQKFSERGYENVYLLSGGVEEFCRSHPQLIEGEIPDLPPLDKTRRSSSYSSTGFSRK